MMTPEELKNALEKMRQQIGQSVNWRQAVSPTALVTRETAEDHEEDQTDAPVYEEETDAPSVFSTRRWQFAGWAIVVVFIFGGLAWAELTRIDAAAVAVGTVGVESNRKTVAHLEGGIVKAILVTEGERVREGQPLIRMDNTRARATLDLLRGRMNALLARKARLEAEQRNLPTIEFPPALLDLNIDEKLMDIMDGEMQVLETRARNLDRQDRILGERISKQNAEIRGLKAKRDATVKRHELLKDEHAMFAGLLKDGLVARNRVLAVERARVDAEGDIHDLSAKIAKAGDEIAKLEMERALLTERHQTEIAAEHQETRERIGEVQEKIRAATDILTRTDVLAPEDGVVVALRHHTPGGVIQAGEPVLELVPDNDRYVIDVKIDPNDIDVVYPGQLARVRLSAFNARATPMIEGKVIQVSPDRLTDPQTGAGFFSGRVIPNETAYRADRPMLSPGMQAEVFLVTERRSVLDYLLDPIVRAASRAGRET